MPAPRASAVTLDQFTTFGDLFKYLRHRAGFTQRELSIAVGYSESQISRLEQNQRAPDEASLAARFVPALHIETEREWVARLLELAAASRAAGQLEEPESVAKPPSSPHNLPLQLTSFVGREKELAEIRQLLSPLSRDEGTGEGSPEVKRSEEGPGVRARLVTLTGHGGCGKTRLALKAAASLVEFFPDGVWLIELAPLADPTLVPQTVAAVLGVKEEPGRPFIATLTNHLRDQTVLLVLDNCEHLIAASAQFAEALLHTCPDLHILASSREMLGVAGERAFYVPSLSTPELRATSPVDTLMSYESVRLFVERAAVVAPNFVLTGDNGPAVAQVCQRLDGIPLAIELAAARVKVLRVEQIAARLADAFRLLTGGNRTALPRQQTLQAAMDWSYDLLSEAERRLFNRLSVFAGGWTLEAAEAICTGEGIESAEILDVLVQLVNKSLVLAEREQSEETRYRLLEIIRQYALAKLAASGEADVLRRRHAVYYLVLAEAGVSSASFSLQSSQRPWLDRMETEHDNLRAALTWSQSATGSAEIGLRLADKLSEFGWARGYWSEARIWLEGALAHAEAADHPRAQVGALLGLGFMLAMQGSYAAGQAQLAHGLTLAQGIGDLRLSAWAFHFLGVLAREHDDATTARLQLEESLALGRELGDRAAVALVLVTLGEVAVMQEDAAWATTLLEEGLALNREVKNSQHIGWALNHLGHVAQLQGEYRRAARLHEEGLLLFQELGVNPGIVWAHQSLGETALAQGDVALATPHFMEALLLSQDLGDRAGMAWCLTGLAGAAALDEEPERAAWLWGAAEALRQSIGAREAPAARATHERLKAEVRKQLGEAVFNAKWTEGQATPPEQAIALALRSSA